ncbi:MAG TPA: DUF4136 domain-containing protein [Holophagaceae bacterium]|nr:DUF4136 domain-containing protein [Holophagaceae bacterium]
MRLSPFAPILLLALAACSPYTIKRDFDPSAPLAAYRTYDWYKPKAEKAGDAPPRMSAFNDARVRAAVERELGARNLKRETAADPDVLLDYFPVYQNRHYTTHTRVGVGTGGWGWGMRTSIGTSRRHTYKEGTIVLQMVDFKTNKLVWEGVAEGALTDLAGNPQEAEEAIGRAVKDLLEEFPPKK